ncbi:MAG TPA: AraC family transcriptional regulator, partial [Thermomicrobiales bacterium]|nr:AraC family transcriptional regulator [Thermomicrobiales bacterium]
LRDGSLRWNHRGTQSTGGCDVDERTRRESDERLGRIDALGRPAAPPQHLRQPPGDAQPASLQGLRIVQTVDEIAVPTSERHLILMNIGRPYRLEETMDGRLVRTSGRMGDIAIIPAGHEATFRTGARAPQRVESAAMVLDPGVVARLAMMSELDADRIELAGVLGARDPVIERFGTALLAEMDGGGLLGELYLESIATALGIHLLRTHSSLDRAISPVREPAGGLSRTQLRRVVDYIEANLDGHLTIEEMAGVAGLSSFHFSRQFKIATGRPPHRYVIERRVERARVLLATTELPLHEIAALAGFADQSHLARHIRRQLGVTPTALRRS